MNPEQNAHKEEHTKLCDNLVGKNQATKINLRSSSVIGHITYEGERTATVYFTVLEAM